MAINKSFLLPLYVLIWLILAIGTNVSAQTEAKPLRADTHQVKTTDSGSVIRLLKADSNQTHSLVFRPRLSAKDSINSRRLKTLLWGGSAFYAATLTGLSVIWYDDYTKFRFFDDNAEWKQVDKVGHAFTAFSFSQASLFAFEWVGMSRRKAGFWGAMTGMLLMTPIEILDGFSADYGASWGDIIANTSGAMLMYGQYALWDEIRIQPKFSFFPTKLAKKRPELLGKTLPEQFLKDYNGQTYWLSVNIDKFLPHTSRFPKWLSAAFGYGANNMLYGRDSQNLAEGFDPYRQYYLSLDIDLTAIRTRSKVLKILLYLADSIHLPAPTLEYNRKTGLKGHWIYF
jgi:uncharacterized protein YfiM (DUF2279 family)